ncbi:hypothetical protein B0I35DRAFT_21570 [Stachybotrys elegans]|uniref:Uncharacterized protein n=1 Tax=Stachybotrys elegans TaxID=80388 RepID=A0A8K0SYR5_9HYPO|nr:hypothetical protein B0I35DRAFT_21570 [Stachybotrys elegans]
MVVVNLTRVVDDRSNTVIGHGRVRDHRANPPIRGGEHGGPKDESPTPAHCSISGRGAESRARMSYHHQPALLFTPVRTDRAVQMNCRRMVRRDLGYLLVLINHADRITPSSHAIYSGMAPGTGSPDMSDRKDGVCMRLGHSGNHATSATLLGRFLEADCIVGSTMRRDIVRRRHANQTPGVIANDDDTR